MLGGVGSPVQRLKRSDGLNTPHNHDMLLIVVASAAPVLAGKIDFRMDNALSDVSIYALRFL